jgi:hypothetical protein
MPFHGSGAVVWPGVVAPVMLLPFMPFVKPWFVDIRPCGTKGDPTPPLPAASAEAPNASNNPAAVTNAT